MGNKLRSRKAQTLVLGTATLALLWLPAATRAQTSATQDAHSQSAATQDRQDVQTDDITRRDLAKFDQFLDGHREIAGQLRRTPSLIDDPQYLQGHPELNTYLEDHPNVKQAISERPDTFMRLEDRWERDSSMRDRDAGGQDRDADRRNDAGGQNHNADQNEIDRLVADFERFLDGHREVGEQVRRNPSLCNDQAFLQGHQVLVIFLQENPGVRDQLRQDPNGFIHRADFYARNSNPGDHDNDWQRGGQDRDDHGQGRDAFRRDAANFNRFLDDHREVAEQVRRDPTLLDNREFVHNHPELQAYLQSDPGVRDLLRQDPNGFMRQVDADNRDWNIPEHGPAHDRMADFGGFLGNHSDIQRDLSRDPMQVKDHDWMQNHTDLDAYLNAHPDVRTDLMANPQGFVQGAQHYTNGGSGTGTGSGAGVSGSGTGSGSGAGVNGHGTSTTGSSTGTSTSHETKPNQ
jgi:hypothetical protein